MEKQPEKKALTSAEQEEAMRKEFERRVKEQEIDPESDTTAGK